SASAARPEMGSCSRQRHGRRGQGCWLGCSAVAAVSAPSQRQSRRLRGSFSARNRNPTVQKVLCLPVILVTGCAPRGDATAGWPCRTAVSKEVVKHYPI